MVLMLRSGSSVLRVPDGLGAQAAPWRRTFPRLGRVRAGSGVGCEHPERGSKGHELMRAPQTRDFEGGILSFGVGGCCPSLSPGEGGSPCSPHR